MELHRSLEETITGASEDIRAGRRTCVDLLESCLEKIDEWEARIHAWVHVDRQGAFDRARELDAELTAGNWRGRMHGIPIGIKDIVDVAGFPTAAGSMLLAEAQADCDAPLVASLRSAGAVILGKTVTTQFACYDPPVTRNPWNLEHTPGGSSSGSAAAVATGMCLAAIGSQTGGSITRPASFCGVAGFKPTFGRVSVDGVFPVAQSLDHPGPIAPTVRDLAIVAAALIGQHTENVGPDGARSLAANNDVAASDSSPSVPGLADAIFDAIQTHPLLPPKLGRVRGAFDEDCDPAMRDAMRNAIDRLVEAGAEASDVALPESFGDVSSNHRTVMAAEAAAVHQQRLADHPDDYLSGVRSLIEAGLAISAVDYVRARHHQVRLKLEIMPSFAGFDVLVCPATIGTAPDITTTGDPSFNAPWSYTGLPTVSIPMAVAENGLPLAMQLVGRPMSENSLFRTAAWCEDVLRES